MIDRIVDMSDAETSVVTGLMQVTQRCQQGLRNQTQRQPRQHQQA